MYRKNAAIVGKHLFGNVLSTMSSIAKRTDQKLDQTSQYITRSNHIELILSHLPKMYKVIEKLYLRLLH